MLGLDQLELQRDTQTIFWSARSQPDQAFTALQHGPTGQRLESIKIGLTCCIGFLYPVAPQCLHCGFERIVTGQTLRLDARADRIGHKGFDARLRPGVAPHQIAAFGAQFGIGG